MRIESSEGENCVCVGLSIMRLVLGYKAGTPGPYERGSKSTAWMIEHAQEWFPDHKVFVYATEDSAMDAKVSHAWAGDTLPKEGQDEYLIGFSYSSKTSPLAHFVVGHPVIYEGMECHGIIAVELEPHQSPPES